MLNSKGMRARLGGTGRSVVDVDRKISTGGCKVTALNDEGLDDERLERIP